MFIKFNRRIGGNLIAYSYYQFVTLAVQFLLVPFFLKYWGKELYGEWIVLAGIPTMLTLLDFGVTQASASRATIEAAAGEWEKVRVTLNSALAFNLIIIAVTLPILCGLSFFLNLPQIFNLNTFSKNQASAVLCVLCISLGFSMLSWILEATFRASDRFVLGNILLANRRLLDVIVSIVCLVLGFSPVKLVLTLLVIQILYLLGVLVVCRRISPKGVLGVKSADRKNVIELARPAAAYLTMPVAQVVTLQGSTQFLQQLSGPMVVVGFTMVRTLMRIVLQLGQVLGNALRPEVSRLVGLGQVATAEKTMKKYTYVVSVIGVALYLLIVFSSPLVLNYWSHGTVSMKRSFVALIGLHSLVSLLWFVPATFKFAQNRHSFLIKPVMLSSVGALIVWISLGDAVHPYLGASLLLLAPELASLCALRFSSSREKIVSSN